MDNDKTLNHYVLSMGTDRRMSPGRLLTQPSYRCRYHSIPVAHSDYFQLSLSDWHAGPF